MGYNYSYDSDKHLYPIDTEVCVYEPRFGFDNIWGKVVRIPSDEGYRIVEVDSLRYQIHFSAITDNRPPLKARSVYIDQWLGTAPQNWKDVIKFLKSSTNYLSHFNSPNAVLEVVTLTETLYVQAGDTLEKDSSGRLRKKGPSSNETEAEG